MLWNTGAQGVARCSSFTTVGSIRGWRRVCITMGDSSKTKVGGASGCGLISRANLCILIEYGEGVVSKYTCCQGRWDSDGCQAAKVCKSISLIIKGNPHDVLSLSHLCSFMLQLVSVPH